VSASSSLKTIYLPAIDVWSDLAADDTDVNDDEYNDDDDDVIDDDVDLDDDDDDDGDIEGGGGGRDTDRFNDKHTAATAAAAAAAVAIDRQIAVADAIVAGVAAAANGTCLQCIGVDSALFNHFHR
jgi:hypothetical protein